MNLVAAAAIVLALVSVVFLVGYFVGGVAALRVYRAELRGVRRGR